MSKGKKKRKRRVAIFIDGLNMMNRLRESGWPDLVDVQYLAERLAGNRRLVVCHYCVARPNKVQLGDKRYWTEINYLQKVEKQPRVEVHYGYMVRHGKWIEKKVDVLLATKMVLMGCMDQYHTAILVTADGDLVPAVEAVVGLGKRVETLLFTKSKAYVGELVKVSSLQPNARASYFRPL